MAVRRSHTKSRGGCLQCKQRHVKCDETIPSCGYCIKRCIQCSLDRESSQSDCTISKPPYPIPPKRSKPLSQPSRELELRLLHNWSVATFSTFTDVPKHAKVLQITMPEEGFSHRFLLDIILILSAQHLASSKSDESDMWADYALVHQNEAIRKFNDTLNNITQENCEAAFAASILILIMTFAVPSVAEGRIPSTPVSDVFHIRQLLKGVAAVKEQFGATTISGRFSTVNDNPYEPRSPSDPTDQSITDAFDRLKSLNENFCSHKDACASTIKWLQACCDSHNVAGAIITWPIAVEQDFMTEYENGCPMAALVFAHYAVVLHLLQHKWWARGAGRRLAEALLPSLRTKRPDWTPILDWIGERVSAAV